MHAPTMSPLLGQIGDLPALSGETVPSSRNLRPRRLQPTFFWPTPFGASASLCRRLPCRIALSVDRKQLLHVHCRADRESLDQGTTADSPARLQADSHPCPERLSLRGSSAQTMDQL
jgi:hypothetical protein